MKKLLGLVFAGLFLAGCGGNVTDFGQEDACKMIRDINGCRTCCQDEGWDTGSYEALESACVCKNTVAE